MTLDLNYDDLVGQIAGFTSLRDIDLLELSLLKTVSAMLNPIETSLTAIDSHNNIQKKVDYASGHHGTISTEEAASSEFISACEQLDATTLEYCTVKAPRGALSLFLLSQDRTLAYYVSIITDINGISKAQAQQIIGMLKIYRNFKQLLKESQTDELTGLSNRKSFESTAKKIHESITPVLEEVETERRNTLNELGEYWVAMIDIDHFKRINDNHGHLMGDEVLVRIAQAMLTSLRKDDHLFRYGGEEFSAIIQANNKKDCSAILERIRQAAKEVCFPNIGAVTISIGAEKLSRNEFYLSVVERADKALYFSKNNGRNKATIYEDMNQTSSTNNTTGSNEVDLF